MMTSRKRPDRGAIRGRRGLPPWWVPALAVLLPWTAACSSAEDGNPEAGVTEAHDEGFVEMDSTATARIGLAVVPVRRVADDALSAAGTIIYDLNRVARVGPRAEGRVVRIRSDLGDRVAKGAPLAVLESPELGEAEAAHEQARVELELARENYERERSLFDKGISSRKEMLETRTELQRRRAGFAAAAARHRTLGAVEHGDDIIGARGFYTVSAPLDGTAVERNLMLGQIVGPADHLFTVADLTRLWLILDIYDGDIARVREGLSVEVQTAAFPGERFSGHLSYLGQVVDSVTRTVKARVEIENPDRRLRPGMFATAVIRGLDAAGALAVPEAAVQQIDGRTVVFLPAGPGIRGRFELRDVRVGSRFDGDVVTILAGLSAEDSVVARGSFYLKSELLKGSFGGDER